MGNGQIIFGRTCANGMKLANDTGANKMTDKNERPHDDERDDETETGYPATDATLMERILWVRDRVTRLQKDTTVGSGNYAYKAITHDKVTAFIRPKMVQAGIGSYLSCVEYSDVETGMTTQNGRKLFQHRATFEVLFVNAKNPEDLIVIRQVAFADDHGDKAPGKATSYAMKYALLKTFMIETGEEDEERTGDGDNIRRGKVSDSETMLADLWAIAEECFGDEATETLSAMAKRRFNVDVYGDIPQERFADACKAMRRKAKQLQEKSDA